MEILEIEQKQTLRREEVAERLRELADALARHNDVEFDRGGVRRRRPLSPVLDDVRSRLSIRLIPEDFPTNTAEV